MADLTYTDVHAVEVFEQQTCPAGVNITSGQLVRLDATTGKWALADASASNTLGNRVAVALHKANAGQALTAVYRGVLDFGEAFAALNFDAAVYASDTSGALGDGAGTVSKVVGYVTPGWASGVTADKLLRYSA